MSYIWELIYDKLIWFFPAEWLAQPISQVLIYGAFTLVGFALFYFMFIFPLRLLYKFLKKVTTL